MIAVEVVLGARGNLLSVEASGHAGKGKPGTDIVCAAVTVLLRTTLAVLAGTERGSGEANASPSAQRPFPAVKAETAGRGQLAFRVTAFSETDIPFLEYAAVFLQEGLASLAREYPDAVVMRVTRENTID